MVGADFTNANLSGAAFDGQDLTNAKFLNAQLGPAQGSVDFTSTTLTNTCFEGATLDETDFTYADITCADFSNASLLKASFGPIQDIEAGSGCRTLFVAATLNVDLIATSNWGNTDFTRARFVGLSTFSLKGQDITGAILAETSLVGLDMSGANLTDVDFTKADLDNVNFAAATLNGAKMPGTGARNARFKCIQGYGNSGGTNLPSGATCPSVPVSSDPNTGVDLTQADLRDADFTGAKLDHASLSGARASGATFDGASLVQADLASRTIGGVPTGAATVTFDTFNEVDFQNAQINNVDFSGCTMVGAKFDDTSLDGTIFSEAELAAASFRSAKLQNVHFSSAQLQSADFDGVLINAANSGSGLGADFSCSQLGGANFANATVATANFVNAVMPSASDCCPASNGGSPNCGLVDATQSIYGPVTFPLISKPGFVTCPDGSSGQCQGSQWRLSKNWATNQCGRNHVMRTMWSKPNCGSGPGDYVKFADPNLKACILKTLPNNQTEVLLTTAQKIGAVSCPGSQIKDIGGLENFINLTSLDLSDNQLAIFTLSFVSSGNPSPSNLLKLNLSNNQITTLDLSRHPNLISLSAENNQLQAITLNANAYLVTLNLAHNKLTNFDLPIQTTLALADLSYNTINDVLAGASDLTALQALAYLDLSHNALTTIGSIKGYAYNATTGDGGPLRALSLSCNATFACSSLQRYDGSDYPAAADSQCAKYDAPNKTWVALTNPACPN